MSCLPPTGPGQRGTIVKNMLLVAVSVTAIVFGGVAPADAAPRVPVPGTPTHVTVAGTDDSATLSWRPPRHSGTITGWLVWVKPREHQPDRGITKLRATARSATFRDLHPGTTYTFGVRAKNARGTGHSTTVTYTPPTPQPVAQGLYALDAANNVVRFPAQGAGVPKVVAPNGTGYVVDQRGNVFIPSADGTRITERSPKGTVRTVASGLHVTPDLRIDDAGTLYWTDSVSRAVTRLPVGARTASVVPDVGVPGLMWSVAPNGTVSTLRPTATVTTLFQRTVSGAVSIRNLTASGPFPSGRIDSFRSDSLGNVYVHAWTVGAAGYSAWYVVPNGSDDATRIADRLAFEIGATTDDGFVLLESKQWCAYPADVPKPCAIDRSFSDEIVRSGTTTTTYAVSGITATDRGLNAGVTDDAGAVFASIPDGPTPGLWRIPAGGGQAQQLATAPYSRLSVN